MYAAREVYDSSPLQYVVLEIRYPYAPRLRQQESLDRFFDAIADLFPIMRPNQAPQLTIGSPAGIQLNQQVDQIMRALDRSATKSVTVSPQSIAIETTEYLRFESFLRIVERCLDALEAATPISAIERIGLRYVNEISVPGKISQVSDWTSWLDPRLTSLASVDETHRAVSAQGVVQYEVSDDQFLTMNFAAFMEGGGVVGNDPLKRRSSPPTGPFFVIDLDSFWQPSPDELSEFSRKRVESKISDLHDPIGGRFQSFLTEQLREEFRRKRP